MKLTHFMSTMIRFCIAQIRPAIFDLTLRCADPPVLSSLLLGVNDFILLLSSSSLSSSSSDPARKLFVTTCAFANTAQNCSCFSAITHK
ncbi:hypothetical protein CASFOL_028150 [Castilleja foliolosa]|uniref:Secreted protein n=1 Tax=Castilleja foliolosa TaxID=1961234 RepID=A0ABD3CDU2_9LAMI